MTGCFVHNSCAQHHGIYQHVIFSGAMFSDARQKAVSIPKIPKEQKNTEQSGLAGLRLYFVWKSVHVRTYTKTSILPSSSPWPPLGGPAHLSTGWNRLVAIPSESIRHPTISIQIRHASIYKIQLKHPLELHKSRAKQCPRVNSPKKSV